MNTNGPVDLCNTIHEYFAFLRTFFWLYLDMPVSIARTRTTRAIWLLRQPRGVLLWPRNAFGN